MSGRMEQLTPKVTHSDSLEHAGTISSVDDNLSSRIIARTNVSPTYLMNAALGLESPPHDGIWFR